MDKLKPMDCSNCKAYCCRVIGKILPELDRGDCACVHLTDDNKCEIYDNRPLICNTVKLYYKYFKDKYTIEQWKEMNRQACEALREAESKTEQSESKE